MAELSADGTKILNNYDRFTGVPFNTTIVSTFIDGTSMSDGKVDNSLYFKNKPEFGGGYSLRDFDGQVFVEWFGAKGDGVTNDSPAIQQAYDVLDAFNIRACVTFKPTSRYGMASPVTVRDNVNSNFNGATFVALGTMSTMFTSNTNIHHNKMNIVGGGATFYANGLVDIPIWIKSSKGLTIGDIIVYKPKTAYYKFGDNSSPQTTYELKAYNLAGDTERPDALLAGSRGFWLENVTDSWIYDILTISAETGFFTDTNCAKITIYSSHTWAKGTSGSTIGTGDTKYGFYIQGTDITLNNCYADTPSITGFYLNGSRIILNTPDIFNNPQQSKQNVSGITVTNTSNIVQIICPKFRGNITDPILNDLNFINGGSVNSTNTELIFPEYVYTTNQTGTYLQNFKARLINTPLSFRNNGGAELSNIDTGGAFNGTQVRVTNYSAKGGGSLSQIVLKDDKNIELRTDNILRANVDPTGLFQILSNISVERDTGAYFFRAGSAGVRAKIYSTTTNGVVLASNTKDLLKAEDTEVQTTVPLLGSQYIGVVGAAKVFSGTANPEGGQVGSVGDVYLRTTGGVSSTIWFKISGTATNTGWRTLGQLTQPNVVSLSGSSPTLEAGGGFTFEYRWTLTSNVTVNAPQSPTNGQRILLRLIQDGTGNRTVSTWNTVFRFVNNTPPVLSTVAGAIDLLEFVYDSVDNKWDLLNFRKGS